MKLIDLRDRVKEDTEIQITPKRALEQALKLHEERNFPHDEVIIIFHTTEEENEIYQVIQGGGCSNAEVVWHLEQTKKGILEDNVEYEEWLK